jgi:hypothetical protein
MYIEIGVQMGSLDVDVLICTPRIQNIGNRSGRSSFLGKFRFDLQNFREIVKERVVRNRWPVNGTS